MPHYLRDSKKPTGGCSVSTMVPLTHFGPDWKKSVQQILHEYVGLPWRPAPPPMWRKLTQVWRVVARYKIHNCEVLFRGDHTGDELIDVIEGNRKYVRCLYAYNKVDTVTIEDVDRLARLPNSTIMSCYMDMHLDNLLQEVWKYLGLRRVYTKRRGEPPDFKDPIVLTTSRHGFTVEAACLQLHKSLVKEFNYAMVWGSSTKHQPQRCGLAHELHDEDVLQVVKKTVQQLRRDKGYGEKVQAYYDAYHEKKKKKKPLKT